MAQLDKALTLHHRDGRERVVTTTQEQVAAEFDGFGSKRAVTKAAPKAARKARTARKPAAAKTAKAPTDTSAAAEVTDVS